jgi:hypothetical protein
MMLPALESLDPNDFSEAPTKPDIWSPSLDAGHALTGLYAQEQAVGLTWRERAAEGFLVSLATFLWRVGRVFCRLSARIVSR